MATTQATQRTQGRTQEKSSLVSPDGKGGAFVKTKILSISVFVLAILCFLLIINQVLHRESMEKKEWFRESKNDYRYTVLGETIIEKNGFLASLGSHKIKVSVINDLNQRITLFTTEVKDDGGQGDYNIVWTQDGFELTLSGS